MRDLYEFGKRCMEKLDAIGIEYRKPNCWKVNYRAMKRYGQCCRVGGKFEINITYRLLDERVPVEFLEETIIHELIHTVDGCFNHGRKFHQCCELVNDCYTCYNIGTYVRREVSQCIEGYYPSKRKVLGNKYTVVCKCCGHEWGHQRKCRVVNHPEYFHCTCGGKLKVVQNY